MRLRPLLFACAAPIVDAMSEGEAPKRVRKKSTPQANDAAGIGEQPDGTSAVTEPADAPPAPPPAPAEPPRNPWQSETEEAAQRRSASIDDILRQRPGGGGPSRNLPKGWLGWVMLGTVSAWLLSTSIHVLAQGERGILTTLGRYEGTIGPGLNVTMPWPFQQVTRRDVGTEKTTLLPDKEAETLMLTRDGELIDVRLQLRWQVKDLRAFTYTFPDGEAAIRRLADAAIRGAVAETTFDDLRDGRNRAQLQQRVADRLQRVLDAWRAGVSVVGVEITDARPPARLADTFKKIGTANEEATKNRERAEAYARQVRLNAEADAAAFDRAYELYRIAPDVTRERIYYETMEKVLRNNPVVIGEGVATPPPAPAAKPQQGGR